MGFTAFLLKNLLRRKVRSLLTTLAIAMAVGTMVTLLGISEGFENSFRKLFSARGIDLVVVGKDQPLQLLSDLDEKIGAKLLKIPGVKYADWGLTDQINMHIGPPGEGNDVAVLVQGYRSDSFMFDKFHFTSGRKFEAGEKGVCLLGSRQAEGLEKGVGDYVTVAGEKLKVIGVYEAPTVFEDGFVLMPLSELQRMNGRIGKVTGFSIILDDYAAEDPSIEKSVQHAVESLTNDQGKSLRLSAKPLQSYVSTSWHIQLSHAMAWMISVIAVVIGAVGMLNTMLMAVFERVKEIGILRAIGWRRARVIRMVLGESLVLSLIGALVGGGVAIVLTRWLTTFPQVAGYIDGHIPARVLLEGALMALAVGLIGGIYPALRAANLKPTEALRHE